MTGFLVGAVAFIVLIVLVVGVHELGHFTLAKASGIRVDEFAIGFGPRLLQRRRGETVYSIRALPLGGFVKMPGMSSLEEDDGGGRGFMHASTPRKVAVMLAGVTFNFLFAGLLFGIVSIPGHAATAPAGGAARQAGMRDGDVITAVDGRQVDTGDLSAEQRLLHDATAASNGRPLQVTFRRAADGGSVSVAMRPQLTVVSADTSQLLRTADGAEYRGRPPVVDSVGGAPIASVDLAALLAAGRPLAIVAHDPDHPATVIRATLRGAVLDEDATALGRVTLAWRLGYGAGRDSSGVLPAIAGGFRSIPGRIRDNVTAIWDVLTTPNSGGISNFAGPVGIAHETAAAAQDGFLTWLGDVALISLSLGIVNVLPIPPFDGGRLAIVVGEAVARRQLAARVEMGLVAAGAVAIVTLALLITINDIKSF